MALNEIALQEGLQILSHPQFLYREEVRAYSQLTPKIRKHHEKHLYVGCLCACVFHRSRSEILVSTTTLTDVGSFETYVQDSLKQIRILSTSAILRRVVDPNGAEWCAYLTNCGALRCKGWYRSTRGKEHTSRGGLGFPVSPHL